MNLDDWHAAWPMVPAAAMADLRARLGMDGAHATKHIKRPEDAASESHVQSAVRLEAAQKDVLLWRNNVGALMDERGVPVRYGLANESPAMNKVIKSSDLVGVRKVLITPAHVGRVIGQFTVRECKHGGWVYRGDKHEAAQKVFIDLVLSYGGDAAFAPGVGTI